MCTLEKNGEVVASWVEGRETGFWSNHVVIEREESRKDSSTTSPSKAGHSIRTGYNRERKADPQNIRKRLQSGFKSNYDKFYRVSLGSIKKPKQNAFEYSAALADKSRYKALLERHTGNSMFKYNAWTNRSSILFDTKSSSPSRGKGAVPLSGAACVDDVDTAKMVTSTVLPWPANSLEQKLACEEVYSPEFIPKLWNKYGAVAREREKQIQREEEKKRKCEQETEELFKSIDQRLESHLKITQVCFVMYVSSCIIFFFNLY